MSNLVLYLLYLAVTFVGVGHKSAMTGLYLLGVLQTFVFNRNWSFRHAGRVDSALVRYVVAYAAGYLLNLATLVLLVDRAGLPHRAVQGVMICVLAVLLFLAQRYWVFWHRHELAPSDLRTPSVHARHTTDEGPVADPQQLE
ncbi:MAG: GtrA family protein [Polyangiaceae bacterium]|nr:GtrA family protein [Polyangiaceae bacterium]